MGNTRSTNLDKEEDVWWTNGQTTKMEDFKKEFAKRQEVRQKIIAEKRKEMQDLRQEVIKLKEENANLKCNSEETNRLRLENEELQKRVRELTDDLANYQNISEKNRELRLTISEIQKELLSLSSEISNFEQEREDYRNHVIALKDVIRVSKQMLLIREDQIKELKQKVEEIEVIVASKDITTFSDKLKAEYEKQLLNIKNLRLHYEERQKADRKEKIELRDMIEERKRLYEEEHKKNVELEENVKRLEEDNSKKYDEIKSLESNLGLAKAECRQYQAELSVINQLFSQILLGFNNSQELDMDKLIKQLEENHGLLQNIVINEESSAVSSALPKLLLDLVNEVDDKRENDASQKLETIIEETESQTSSLHQFNSAAEIVENLPKVWRVLIELLSHQTAPNSVLNGDENPCYKMVETPKGPSLTLSVSQTFIRLKDLILEKNCVEKETLHLKLLNTHLEARLQDQEKRLETVSSELSKTWHIVGKLQKQHQLLHTQEKILRYELAQKRKMLTTLKEELEYGREKWLQAREKNSNTEEQWKQLRTEFASRKVALNDDLNNSVESGYSDEKECSSDDEPGYETDVSKTEEPENDAIDNLENIIESEKPENTIEKKTNAKLQNLIEIKEPDNGVNEKPKTDTTDKLENVTETSENDVTDNPDNKESENGTNDKPKKIIDVIQAEIEDIETGSIEASHSELKTENQELVQNVEEPNKTEELPSTLPDPEKRSFNEILQAKEERMKRLEELTSGLVKQVTNTTNRSVAICHKLEDLHEIYGESSSSHDPPRETSKKKQKE